MLNNVQHVHQDGIQNMPVLDEGVEGNAHELRDHDGTRGWVHWVLQIIMNHQIPIGNQAHRRFVMDSAEPTTLHPSSK